MESMATSATYGNKQPEPTSTFTSMCLDIHTSVLHHLEPLDIISVRKTCKAFFDATQQRIVWIIALKKMCLKNTVYFHSYPVDDMSVLELEYAASSPERWNRYFRKHDEERDFMPPSVTRTLPFPDQLSQQGGFPNFLSLSEQLYLVPGGRFLVTLLKNSIQVWDLGLTGSTELKPELIAENPSKGLWFSTHMTPDGEGLRIINSYRYDGEGQWRCRTFEVFEIFPWKPDAELKMIATLSIESQHPLDFTSMVGDLLICVHGPIIKIWNFVTHGWATWNTGKPSQQILATDNSIILIESDNLSVWDIPTLSYELKGKSPTIEPDAATLPRTRIAYPTNFQSFIPEGNCHGLDDWYTGSSQPHWFDFITRPDQTSSHRFHRFRADIDDLDLPTLSSVCSFDVFREPTTSFGSYRVCGDDISILTLDFRKIALHAGSSSPGDEYHSCILVSRHSSWNGHQAQVSFCPISRRLCYITPTDVTIVDYSSSLFNAISSI